MRFVLLALTAALSGCVINGVRPHDGGEAPQGRAVVVYGVTVAGAWGYPRFGVTLDRYDISKQAITGNCFTFDRLEANVPATPAPTRYFAFDAPPGHYVFSAFNSSRFGGRNLAFQAQPGRAVYIGNFVLGEQATVTLHRELDDAARQAVAAALPTLAVPLQPASQVIAEPARMFLCTP
ncbi:hypothetical protein [Roseateles sp.]|uniref:hypothetical protein n=1 Tax=Roseateles sp. TaxID=1971397 RepID=UPI003266D91A